MELHGIALHILEYSSWMYGHVGLIYSYQFSYSIYRVSLHTPQLVLA